MTSSLSITRRAPKSSGAETSSAGQFPASTAALDRVAQTILEFAKEILALSVSKSTIDYRPLPEDDPKVRKPDIGRARKLLG